MQFWPDNWMHWEELSEHFTVWKLHLHCVLWDIFKSHVSFINIVTRHLFFPIVPFTFLQQFMEGVCESILGEGATAWKCHTRMQDYEVTNRFKETPPGRFVKCLDDTQSDKGSHLLRGSTSVCVGASSDSWWGWRVDGAKATKGLLLRPGQL